MATDTRQPAFPPPAPDQSGTGTSRPDRPAVVQKWHVDVRLLLWTLLAIGILAPAAWFWHRAQVQRHSAALLEHARGLFEKKEWGSASASFHRYLQLRPGDTEAVALRALAFDKLTLDTEQRNRAVSLLFQAVEANPDRTDLRLRLAERLYQVRRFKETAEHAGRVSQALTPAETVTPPEPLSDADAADLLEADRLIPAALKAQLGPAREVQPRDVVKAYKASLKKHPGDVPLSLGLAELLRKQPEAVPSAEPAAAARQADETIDEMVAKNRASEGGDLAQALLGRFRYRTAYRVRDARTALENARGNTRGELQKRLDEERRLAATDLEDARRLAPDDADVLLASAYAADDRARAAEPGDERDAARAEALAFVRRSIEVTRRADLDDDVRKTRLRGAYLALATLHNRWNATDEAVAALREGLGAVGENDLELNRRLLPVQLVRGETDDFAETLARLEPVVRRIGPYLTPTDRRRLGEEIEVARAQLELMRGDVGAAIPRLKRMAASVTEADSAAETQVERLRRWRLLASAYSRAGLNDLAGAACDELVRLEPTSKESRLMAAAQWRAAGNIDRAVRNYEAATVGKPEVPLAWLLFAEARLDQELRKPSAESREWKGVAAALKKARDGLGESPAVVLLDATLAIARNETQRALALLNALAAKQDLDRELLPRLAVLLQSAGAGAAADQALDRYRDAGGDAALLALAKADVLRRRQDVPSAIQVLDEALETVPESQRTALLRRLIAIEIDTGAMLSARQRLAKLRRAGSREFWVYELAGDLALLAHDTADLKECIDELASPALEGPGGTRWRYFKAAGILDDSRKDSQEAAAEVDSLVGEIELARRGWSQTMVLRGRLALRQGRMDEAADSFEQALQGGARGLTVFNWLLTSLYNVKDQQDGLRKASAYIRQIGQIAAFSGDLSTQAVPANLQAGNIKDALRVAKSAAGLRPRDPLTLVWYGQTLALADQPDEAEAILKKAAALAPADSPTDARTRTVLIWFYGRQRRLDDARQALAELVEKIKMTPTERALVLARGSDMIGDRHEAEQHFLEALAEKKKDSRLLEEVGRFYSRFDHDKALDFYQQALAADPKSPEARRAVVALIGMRGTDADWSRVVALLNDAENSKDKATADDDRRLQATLLLVRGGADNARKAAALLEEIIASEGPARPADRLLLTRALEEIGQIEQAKDQFETVLKDSETPAFLVAYVDFLTRHKLYDEAGKALARLEEKDPANARLLELRVAWLDQSQHTGEIEPAIDAALEPRLEAAKDDSQKAAILRYAAELLSRVKLYGAAEKRLREVAGLLPTGYESLAQWLAQRERFDEALELCRQKAGSAELASQVVVLVRILTLAANRSPGAPLDAADAEASLASSLQALRERQPAADETKADRDKRDRELVAVLIEAGVLRTMQGREAEAVALYEEAQKTAPDNVVILNNLAVLLAEIPGGGDRALTLIDRAVAAVPNSLELLDSKALVLIGAGRFAEARDLLDRLCHSNHKNARYRLHLAYALFRLDEVGPARAEIEQARKNGLDNELLTPPEHRQIQEIIGTAAAE